MNKSYTKMSSGYLKLSEIIGPESVCVTSAVKPGEHYGVNA